MFFLRFRDLRQSKRCLASDRFCFRGPFGNGTVGSWQLSKDLRTSKMRSPLPPQGVGLRPVPSPSIPKGEGGGRMGPLPPPLRALSADRELDLDNNRRLRILPPIIVY